MQIRLNGEIVETRAHSVALLLEERNLSAQGIAVAVNDSVVRRAHHASHQLSEGDRVEIIRAVQGG